MNIESKKIKELKMKPSCIKNINNNNYIRGPDEYKLIKQKMLHIGGRRKKTRKFRRTRNRKSRRSKK
jgi:hypothetical protein